MLDVMNCHSLLDSLTQKKYNADIIYYGQKIFIVSVVSVSWAYFTVEYNIRR